MKESLLLKIALICTILGITVLYIFSEVIEVDEVAIKDIDESYKGNKVKILGSVEQVINTGEVTIVKISQKSTIDVFIPDNVVLNQGDLIEVIGKVDEYKEKEEIVADRVRVVN